MITRTEVLQTPAEFATLHGRDLSQAVCVVFDVFRATSTMLEALANGATSILPVRDIASALEARKQDASVLLAGERDGFRIGADRTGGIEFDLGNSPREFTRDRVAGRKVVMTTSNGTRALDACRGAAEVLATSFANLGATTSWIRGRRLPHLVLVCAGTLDHASLEDTLGAGALVDRLWESVRGGWLDDAAQTVREVFRAHRGDLQALAGSGRNGARLLGLPELADDVPLCLVQDRFPFVARMGSDGLLRAERASD